MTNGAPESGCAGTSAQVKVCSRRSHRLVGLRTTLRGLVLLILGQVEVCLVSEHVTSAEVVAGR